MEFESLQDQMPYWHFDGTTMIFSDGSLGAGFQLKGLDINCSTTEETNEIAGSLEHLVSGMDEGISLQVFHKVSTDHREKIRAHAKEGGSPSPAYGEIKHSRIAFLKENMELGEYFKTDTFLFVRSQPHGYPRRWFWESQRKYEGIFEKDYDTFKKTFARSVRKMENALNRCGLSPVGMTPKDWHGLCFAYFNPQRVEKLGIPKYRRDDSLFSPTFTDQICGTDVGHAGGTIRADRMMGKVVTLDALPEGLTYAAMVQALAQLPFPCFLVQGIRMEDQKRELEKLQIKRRLAHSFASGSSVGDLESESTLHHTEELARELVEGSEKVVSMDLSIVVWDESLEALEDKTDAALGSFRAMGQSEGNLETYAVWDAFAGCAPGTCRGLRPKKTKSSNASHLMPVYGHWEGHRPVCLLPTRDHALFSLDPFAKEMPNWNGLVFGGSGAGKSFTVSQLMLQFHGQKPTPQIVWIDNGASSERLLEILDGEFINLNLESNICLNMFDDIKGGKNSKLVLAALEFMLGDKTPIPKRDRAVLEEAIAETYKRAKNKTPVLSDLRRVLKKHKHPSMRGYAETLYPWTGKTAFGKMLDGQSNIRLEKDLVTIETKGLDDYPDLQSVFLLLLTDYIKREAETDLERPYLLIIDEAWKLLESPSGSAFTVEAYRTFRKFNGGIWCISQHYKDFLKNDDIKNAVFPNTASVFVLRQKKIDWGDFQTTMDFAPEETELVKSLEVVKGEYSEFLYIQDENKTVLRLIPDPLSYWICTTDGNEKMKIEKKKRQNPGLKTVGVLKILANERKENIG